MTECPSLNNESHCYLKFKAPAGIPLRITLSIGHRLITIYLLRIPSIVGPQENSQSYIGDKLEENFVFRNIENIWDIKMHSL